MSNEFISINKTIVNVNDISYIKLYKNIDANNEEWYATEIIFKSGKDIVIEEGDAREIYQSVKAKIEFDDFKKRVKK